MRLAKKISFICLIAMLSVTTPAHDVSAEVDYETEQSKLNTEDAGPVEPGDIEVEFAYGFATGKHQYSNGAGRQDRGRFRSHTYDVGFAFGVFDDIELNLGIGYADLLDKDNDGPTHGQGWADLEVGSKLQLYHSDEKEMTFSYAPSVSIPSGRESREDRLGPGEVPTVVNQRFIVSKNWGRWNANLDSGYGLLIGHREGARGTWDTNFAIGYQIFSWLQPAMEFHFAHDFVKSENDSNNFAMTWGLIMPLHERFRLDAGAQQALAGRNSDQTTTVSAVATLFI